MNGGIGGNSPSNQTIRVGESVTVPSLPAGITNGTLVFIGWSTLSTNAGANFVRAGNTYIIPAVRVPQPLPSPSMQLGGHLIQLHTT